MESHCHYKVTNTEKKNYEFKSWRSLNWKEKFCSFLLINITISFLILKTAFLLKVMSRFCQGQRLMFLIVSSILILAAEAIGNVFFDAHFNSSDSSLFSVWDITGCVFFALYRSACAGVWDFAAVSYQTVRWWIVANLRYFFLKNALGSPSALLKFYCFFTMLVKAF